MSTSPDSREYKRLDQLADEFVDRYRRGERPGLQEFVDRLPEMAEEIRAIFPAMVEVERADADARERASPAETSRPARVGDYRILREVGRGGMGVVYEAEQVSLGRRVALKVLPGHITADRKSLERFRREAKAAAKLHHTNIVPVFEVGRDGDIAFYTMQFIEGQALDQVIDELARLRDPGGGAVASRAVASGNPDGADPVAKAAESLLDGRLAFGDSRHRPGDVPTVAGEAATEPGKSDVLPGPTPTPTPGGRPGVPLASASHGPALLPGGAQLSSVDSAGHRLPYFRSVAMLGRQAAQGLAFAHARGVVHRDIKPSNLLLDTSGVVWITDFGLAKADSEDDGLTATGDIIGTLRYMAPERFRGGGDARSDVYALGLTLYELVTLRPAHATTDRLKLIERIQSEEPIRPKSLDRRIPRDLETIVLKAGEKDPGRRYQSADELAEDLRRFLADEPIRARRTSTIERYSRWARRNPGIALLGATLTAVLIIAAVGSTITAARFRGVARDMTRLADEKEAERVSAVAAKAQAEAAKGQADESRREADRQRNSAVRTLYFAKANLLGDALDAKVGLSEVGRFLQEWRGRDLDDDPRAWEWSYLYSPPRQLKRVLHGHSVNVMAVAWSPDGKQIASGGFDDPIYLWDADTGVRTGSIGGSGPSMKLAWSPDGRSLAEATYSSNLIRVWDVASGANPVSMAVPFDGGPTLAWSPDGKRLAWGCAQVRMPARVYDSKTGKLLLELEDGSLLSQVAWSPDGKNLAGAGSSWAARVWDAGSGKLTARLGKQPGRSFSIGWSPDGRRIACGSEDGTIEIWDFASRKRERTSTHHDRPILRLVWSPDGRQIAFTESDDDPPIGIWDFTGAGSEAVLNAHQFGVMGLAWSPDGKELASAGGGWNGEMKIWRAGELSGFSAPTPSSVKVPLQVSKLAIAWSPADPRLAVATAKGMVRIRDTASGLETDLVQAGMTWPKLMIWDPAGTRLAVSMNGKAKYPTEDPFDVKIFDVATRKALLTIPHGLGNIHSISWSPDGRYLLTAHYYGESGTIRLWDAATGRLLSDYSGTSVSWSPDGRRFAVGDNRKLVVRDAGGAVLLSWSHQSNVHHLITWSPSGRLLAVPYGNEVDLWDAATGQPKGRLVGHTLRVLSVEWHPDGERLATGAEDGTVRIWDTRTASLAFTFRSSDAAILNVAWSADGLRLASLDRDLTVRIWDASSGAEADHTPDLLPSLERRLAIMPDDANALRSRAIVRARLGEWDRSAADFERAAAIAGKGGPGWSRTGWWRLSSDPEGLTDPFNLSKASADGASTSSAKPPRWYANADDPNGWVPVTRNPPTLATRVYSTVPRDIRLRTDRYVLDSWWNGRPAKLEPGVHRLNLRKGWNTLVLRFAEREGLDAELGKPNSGLYARLFDDAADLATLGGNSKD